MKTAKHLSGQWVFVAFERTYHGSIIRYASADPLSVRTFINQNRTMILTPGTATYVYTRRIGGEANLSEDFGNLTELPSEKFQSLINARYDH